MLEEENNLLHNEIAQLKKQVCITIEVGISLLQYLLFLV